MEDSAYRREREAATDLVSRILRGDGKAEAEMIQRYSRPLRYLLRRKTRDLQLVEDLLQETWTVAVVKLREKGLEDPGRLAGWLTGIANFQASNAGRKESRQRTMVNSNIVDLIPDESSNPFRQVSRAEASENVRKMIDDLDTKRDREILKRFYVQEEDKDSICRVLGLNRVHFNRVIHRARQRLKNRYLAVQDGDTATVTA